MKRDYQYIVVSFGPSVTPSTTCGWRRGPTKRGRCWRKRRGDRLIIETGELAIGDAMTTDLEAFQISRPVLLEENPAKTFTVV